MKRKRREFIKLAGLAEIEMACSRTLSDSASGPFIDDIIDPSPEWVQNADMFTSSSWYATADNHDIQHPLWKDYDIVLKDVPVKRVVRLASGNGSRYI